MTCTWSRAMATVPFRRLVSTDRPPTHAQSDRKSTRLNSSHANISYAVFCLKKKKKNAQDTTPTCTQHNRPNKLQGNWEGARPAPPDDDAKQTRAPVVVQQQTTIGRQEASKY